MDHDHLGSAKEADMDGSSRGSYITGTDEEAAHQPRAINDKELQTGQQSPAASLDNAEKQAPGQPVGGPVHNVNDVSSVPNGGLRAWLQVAGAWCLFFNTWGIVNTFGIYNTFYINDIIKDETPSTIAWIGSIQAFMLLTVGLLTGPIYDMGHFRPLILTGSFLVVFGHMMLSLCHSFWQILLAQAFCIGIGTGFLFIPSVAILSTYWTSRLALATGIAASGSSMGGVIYPIVLYKLYPQIGFGWTVRVIGFLSLATLLVPNLVMKVRVLPPARRKLIDTTAFKDLPFMLFSVGGFLAFTGLYQPFFFLQDFAIQKHLTSENLGFYLLSILNGASVFGRIFPNFIADKTGPMNVLVPCTIITGILILCLLAVKNLGGVMAVTIFFGFFSGSLVSLPPTVVVKLTPERRFIGTRLGMAFGWVAIGTLIGGPLGGVILNKKGFASVWIFGGVLTTAGGAIYAAARIAFKGPKPWVKA